MFSRVLRVIALQIGLTLIAATLVWALAGATAMRSALCGGACVFVPAAASQLRIWMTRSKDARAALQAQFAGEGLKFAVSLLMFYLVFSRLHPLDAPAFFAVFCLVQLGYFVALLIDGK